MEPAEVFDYEKLAKEAAWLLKHPQFEEKPASILEFLGPEYLNIDKGVRYGVRKALVDIFGYEVQTDRIAKYQKAMFTGAIGVGKTTFASIVLPYMVHWVLCLKDPQGFFNLLPGSRIAFMMMSTSETQARDVIFSDVFARIKYSKWFVTKYPHDSKFTKVIKFPKDVWILPGDSQETTFEGYNILGGVLDEMDSHKQTKDKDYADEGFNTIEGRVTSRFGRRGLIIAIGQMKKSTGFAARRYAEFRSEPDTSYAIRLTLWDARGWDWKEDGVKIYLTETGEHDSFYYDYKRRKFMPREVGELLKGDSDTLLEIPRYYERDFKNKPEKSLKDLAGIPPAVSDPFISLVDKIEFCRDKWITEKFPDEEATPALFNTFSPVNQSSSRPEFAPWFTNKKIQDMRRRCMHVDIAYSADGDALGLTMAHVSALSGEDDEERKPVITFDFLMRIKAPAGTEIMLADVRRIIYYVRDELNFRVVKVTYDGFESTDSVQQLRKKRFIAEKFSVDKSTLAYEDLRDAIYEERCLFPPYITELAPGDGRFVEIAIKELSELQDVGKKIDHPVNGSKDVTDSMAAVVHELMGDRRYRRGVASLDVVRKTTDEKPGTNSYSPAMPIPINPMQSQGIASLTSVGSQLGLVIPRHLQRGS